MAEPFDFTPVSPDGRGGAQTRRTAPDGPWRRLRRDRPARLALGLLLALALFAFLGPLAVPYGYDAFLRGAENLPPLGLGAEEETRRAAGEFVFPHLLGTDRFGRDALVRLMMGTRVSLCVALTAGALVLVVGTTYGAVSGWRGGKTDLVMQRVAEVAASVPEVLVILLVSTALGDLFQSFAQGRPESALARTLLRVGPNLCAMLLAFGGLCWVSLSRVVRGEVLRLKEMEYITAVRALGASEGRILRRHLLPNCAGQIAVALCQQIPTAIFLESTLSFLGVGVSAPMTSLGSLIREALQSLYTYPYRLLFPTAVLGLLILSFQVLGDRLRDALDPRTAI